MMHEDTRTDAGGFELRHFEKNRYFQGKLITALDMLTEQQYHSDRLSTVTKLTSGSGIVSGLDISEFDEDDDRIRLTVQPGLAIDAKGRPIVVRNPTTESLSIPDGTELFVYLTYTEETKDPVPVPGADPHTGEESQESRILEVFEIEARETAPGEYKTTPQIEFPEFEHTDKSFAELADEIAESYHESRRETAADNGELSIFLGSFRKTTQGHWEPGEETKRRGFVYDNDMLFSLLVTHLTDTANPHNTRVGEPTEYVENELGQIQGFAVRLQQLRSDMQALTGELDTQHEYIKHKSLKTTSRFFDALSAEFETHGEVSRTALRIVDAAKDAITTEAYTDTDAYIGFVESIVDDAEALAEAIHGVATEDTYEQYTKSVDELTGVLADDPAIMDVAMALDKLAESAEMLDQRYDVVADQ